MKYLKSDIIKLLCSWGVYYFFATIVYFSLDRLGENSSLVKEFLFVLAPAALTLGACIAIICNYFKNN